MTDKAMRINQFLALCGVASRRSADVLIKQKMVKINGEIISSLATTVNADSDRVEVADSFGRWTMLTPPSTLVVYAINKPFGYTSTVKDPHAEQIVTDLVPQNPRVVPVGRLDKDSQGLMLLTNDGKLAHTITHPSSHVPKTYVVDCHIPPHYTIARIKQNVRKLAKGILLDGTKTMPAHIEIMSYEHDTLQLLFVLQEGKNRQIRRMLQKVGLNVVQLSRTAIGGLTLESVELESGQFKQLSVTEIERIQHD